jgi:hypothetical protein
MPSVLSLPRSRSDLEDFVRNGVQESIHLDYKRSDSLATPSARKEISKDVSAFLNADGGVLVYGIEEVDHLPVGIDAGMDDSTFSRERLEQLILANISPRPDGIQVVQIPLATSRSAYAIQVPKGHQPYQDSSAMRYYKRFNFMSVPMEHYEVEDLRARHVRIERLVNIEIAIRHGILVDVVISNPGTVAAADVSFAFEPALRWSTSQTPPLIANGARSIPPGRRYHFLYDSYLELLNPDRGKAIMFSATVEYRHPMTETVMQETFEFDLRDYMNSAVIESENVEVGKKISAALESIGSAIGRVASATENLGRISSPSGLNISFTALRNLALLMRADSGFTLDPSRYADVDLFQEVLDMDMKTAYRLRTFLSGQGPAKLEELDGLTLEQVSLLRRLFTMPPGA